MFRIFLWTVCVIFNVCFYGLVYAGEGNKSLNQLHIDRLRLIDSYTRELILKSIQTIQLDSVSGPSVAAKNASEKEKREERLRSWVIVAISAGLPGFGQVYNRAYWKVPIVYGVFATLTYFLIDRQNLVNYYSEEYKQAVKNNDPSANQYRFPREALKAERDTFIALLLVAYLLSLVDVYVDAQLWDFDVNEVRDEINDSTESKGMSILSIKIRI